MSSPYERLLALLDDEGNRHGPDRATVAVSVAGGRSRYVWLTRHDERIDVTLFDRLIAVVLPDRAEVTTAGFFTPSTRDALAFVLSRTDYGWPGVTMKTPGSRGGTPGPHSCTISRDGKTYTLTDTNFTTIPEEITP